MAPYRFVELPDVVVPPPQAVEALGGGMAKKGWHNTPLRAGFCGEIAVEWAAETPLLIGDEESRRRYAAAIKGRE